ncbi:unnamed protein product [Ilex paraguariensis]|uniref:BHLH domain-containing protein n=1 Tax=Ilex paraguariensis TaxID=185542 RepID=A0ABC8RWW3_9AQUA
MALDTVVYSRDSFVYGPKELSTMGGASGWVYDFGFQEEDDDLAGITPNNIEQGVPVNYWDYSSSSMMQNTSPEACTGDPLFGDGSRRSPVMEGMVMTSGRRKRRRTKTCKNKEELENQRMTHIAVERNRRKQMNQYLAVIRSLLPDSYVQRSDQASIIGGAINFVKELEQKLQTLEAQKQISQQPNNGVSSIFADFFTFPQYSTRHHRNHSSTVADKQLVENRPALADIEVILVESHANLKILSKRRPKQLLKLVTGLQCLCLTILHLNVTTMDQKVLYSLNVKLQDGCLLTTVDEIADAVNHLLCTIQEEACLS